jgi:hypothetical protein
MKMKLACSTLLEGFQTGASTGARVSGGILRVPQVRMALTMLVMGIAHHTGTLIAVGVRAATKLQAAGLDSARLDRFLQPLESWGAPRALVQELDTQSDTHLPGAPGSIGEIPLCVCCNAPVKDQGCRWPRTPEKGRRVWHVKCLLLHGL